MRANAGTEPESEPGVAVAEAGVVLLDGPDGVAIAMTPDCAEETARRMTAAAHEARTQTPGLPEDDS